MFITKLSDKHFTAIPNSDDPNCHIKKISGLSDGLEADEPHPAIPRLELKFQFKKDSGVNVADIDSELKRENRQGMLDTLEGNTAASPTGRGLFRVPSPISPAECNVDNNSLTFEYTNMQAVRDTLEWFVQKGHMLLKDGEKEAFYTMCTEMSDLPDEMGFTEMATVLSKKDAAALVRSRVEGIQARVLRPPSR